MGIFTDVLSSFLLKYFYLSLIIQYREKKYFQKGVKAGPQFWHQEGNKCRTE